MVVADKSLTVNSASDEQIKALVNRLRNEDDMYHHGVQGMKWGIRKDKALRGRRSGESSADAKNARKLYRKGNISQLSNAEIRQLTERLMLEKSFADLNKVDKRAGRKFVEDVVMGIGKKEAIKYGAKMVDSILESLVKKGS